MINLKQNTNRQNYSASHQWKRSEKIFNWSPHLHCDYEKTRCFL